MGEKTLVEFIVAQLVLIPILGGIWLGIKKEREEQKRLLSMALAAASRRRF